jgi:DNA ligase (NAD+)
VNRSQAGARAEELRREIWHHRKRYFVDDDPILSDADYDALERELVTLETRWPDLVTPDSPTQRVGAEVTGELPIARHAAPMLSLDNVTDEAEFHAWHDRLLRALGREEAEAATGRAAMPFSAELKIDGVSVSLVYEDGKLERAVTRGDGTSGEVVTSTVRTIPTVPLRLLRPVRRVEARGEVYYPLQAFAEMNRRREEAGEALFANPRNAAAGSLRLLDPALASTRPLDLFVWSLARIEGEPLPPTHSAGLALLRDLGLKVNPASRRCATLPEVEAYFARWREERDSLPYEVDGVVFKVDDLGMQEQAGATARAPRWACAWKFPPGQATTRVLRIDVQVGRTGALTPVAILEPVRLAGSTIQRCTLHNEDEVRRKDVRAGDTVLIEKGGDVIPKIVKTFPETRGPDSVPFVMPSACPACGSAVVRVPEEVASRCVNASCPARLKESILHFAGRSAMDIEGLGEALVDQLLARGLVRTLDDVYRLDEETLAGLERMGKKSAANLVAQVRRSRDAPLERVLYALGIRFIGERTAELLAEEFGSIPAISAASVDDLMQVHEVGERVAAAIRQFFDQPENQRLIERLASAGVTMKASAAPKRVRAGGPWDGKVVVVTGAIPGFSRDAIRAMIRAGGGRVTESLSKKTDILVCGADPGSKLGRARELEVRIMETDEFLRLAAGRRRDGEA